MARKFPQAVESQPNADLHGATVKTVFCYNNHTATNHTATNTTNTTNNTTTTNNNNCKDCFLLQQPHRHQHHHHQHHRHQHQ